MGLEKIGTGGSEIPSGVIWIWSGDPNNIPDGWTLCDGSDGAPDLQNRFVVGAGDEYSEDDTGGEKDVNLSVDELPSHDHRTLIFSSFNEQTDVTGAVNRLETTGNDAESQWSSSEITDTGGDQSHENRPPYYALAYIMKL